VRVRDGSLHPVDLPCDQAAAVDAAVAFAVAFGLELHLRAPHAD
jgi:hypothetical protein